MVHSSSNKLGKYGEAIVSDSMDIKKNGHTSLFSEDSDSKVRSQLPKLASLISFQYLIDIGLLIITLSVNPEDISRNLSCVSYSTAFISP